MRRQSILLWTAAIMVVLGLCVSVLAAWSELVPLTEVNTEYKEKLPFLSFDGLTLYFCRLDTDTFYYTRIFQATRPVPYGPFTAVQNISELNYSGGHVASPWVSPDNLRMYYYRTEPGSLHRLKVSERTSITDPWPEGSNISELNSLGNLDCPSLTQDELIIVFISTDIPGGIGDYDIYIATRPDRYSSFGNVRNLSEINSTTIDGAPYISPDGLTLFFHSNRNGSTQIFRGTRGSLSEPFGNLVHLSLFDTPGGGSGFSRCSSDGKSLYFTSWLSGGTGDIYVSYFDSGPIAYWKFDEGTGSIAYDSAGDNDGTIYGADWTTGLLGGALDFDGIDDYVDMADTVKNHLETSYTFSIWIKPKTILGVHCIAAYRRSTYDIGYQVLLQLQHYNSDVQFIVGSLGNNAIASYPDALTTNTWYHIAGTREENALNVYVNGVSGIPDSETFVEISPDNFKIGAIHCCDQVIQSFFDGTIEDVRVYDRALSAEEVQQLYQSGLPILVDVDIKPGSCPNPLNVTSRGVLPVAILGSSDLGINTIVATSVRLAGVAPIRDSYEDVATEVSDANECECSTEGPDG
ncbi:MAG: LamG-like jellyroll fold domain-containing protein [Planctomycetota bacterium]|jgi:hypothetical protein